MLMFMEMMSELIFIDSDFCPRCGKKVVSAKNIKGMEVNECERCRTAFKNHVVVYLVDDEDMSDYEILDNN